MRVRKHESAAYNNVRIVKEKINVNPINQHINLGNLTKLSSEGQVGCRG